MCPGRAAPLEGRPDRNHHSAGCERVLGRTGQAHLGPARQEALGRDGAEPPRRLDGAVDDGLDRHQPQAQGALGDEQCRRSGQLLPRHEVVRPPAPGELHTGLAVDGHGDLGISLRQHRAPDQVEQTPGRLLVVACGDDEGGLPGDGARDLQERAGGRETIWRVSRSIASTAARSSAPSLARSQAHPAPMTASASASPKTRTRTSERAVMTMVLSAVTPAYRLGLRLNRGCGQEGWQQHSRS